MKKFFLVLLIIQIVFLALAAGSIAVVQYGSIKPNDRSASFAAGWGVTLMPYYGSDAQYPPGDVMLVRQAAAGEVQTGDVALYADGGAGFMAGMVIGKSDDGFQVAAAGGAENTVAAVSVAGVYRFRLPGAANLLGTLRSPLGIGVSAAVLILTLLLWRLLPGKRAEEGALSPSDGDIASNLY